jgi:3D (Asp-Asp-Asp) domain-containing protein
MPVIGGLVAFLLLSNIVGAAPAHADLPASPSYPVTLTAYNAVPSQTDSTPYVTASGSYSNPEVVAARSQDLAEELPFGTVVEIIGPADKTTACGYDTVAPIIGYRVIADTMNARYANRIDILFSTRSNYLMAGGAVKNAGTILGICKGAFVRVVGRIDIKQLPKTQEDLVALITGNSTPLALK